MLLVMEIYELQRAIKAKQAEHDLDDVDLVDALDLEKRIKKLKEDFSRLLKAKKAKETEEAKLKNLNRALLFSSISNGKLGILSQAQYGSFLKEASRNWCTASVRTLDNRELELNATVDGQDKTITELSVMRHLKLADASGISTLPTTKIFEQLALMGKTRTRIRRMGIRIPQSNVLSSVADEAITKEMHDRLGSATTTAFSLEAE
nr:hypothetical protein [Tanacetum cinerariifolium]